MVEAGVLNLPALENGVLAIGDLWDSRTSKRVGFNLFANNLTLDDVEVIQVDDSSNVLKQSKSTHETLQKLKIGAEVSAELLGGLLKISGGLDFEKADGKKLAQEVVEWVAHRKTYELLLKADNPSDIEDIVDEKVKTLIQEGKIHPTHVVKRVQLGGSAMGSIKIAQTNTNTKYKVGFFVAGEINLVIASAQVKVEAEVSEEVRTSNYEKRVSLKSVPPLKLPVELTDFITLPSQMDIQMKLELHFPEYNQIHGIPSNFILVPISQYVNGPPDKDPFQAPPPELVEGLMDMLGEIRDWSNQQFLRHKLLYDRPELLKILSDPSHELSQQVIEKETNIRNETSGRETQAFEIYLKNKKIDQPNWEELQIKVEEYKSQNYAAKINEFAEEFKEKGKEELAPITIPDEELEETSDEKCPLQFFTNEDSLKSWMSTDSTQKILFRTKLADVKSEGLQIRLYKMGVLLGKYGMESGIAYPSVSPPVGVMEPLEIKTQMEWHSFGENGDAKIMISVLEAAVGRTSRKEPSSRVFGVFAEFLGIPLPMTDKLEHIIPLFHFIKTKTNGFEIINDSNSTIEIMLEKTKKYKYVVTSDALHSITDNIPSLQFINSSNGNGRLIVGTFASISELNAPNLFLCYDGDLLGICMDYLDTMILIHIDDGSTPTPDFSILSPTSMNTNSFSPSRLPFANAVAKYFGEFEPAQTSLSYFPPNSSENLKFALSIATSLLEDQARSPVAIATALIHAVKQTLGEQTFPRKLPGWSEAENAIILKLDDSDKWNMLHNELKYVLYKEQQHFVFVLQEVISELEVFYGGIEEEEEDPMELHPIIEDDPEESKSKSKSEEEPPVDLREELKIIIERVITDPDCPEELAEQVSQIFAEIKHLKVMARFVTIALRKEVAKILDPEKYFHFMELIEIVGEIAQSSGLSRITQEKILEEYVYLIKDLDSEKYPDCERNIKEYMRNKKNFSLVRTLAACHVNHHLYLIHREFERFTRVKDWAGIVRLVEKMNKAEFSSQILEYVWGNPKFVFIIDANIENIFVLDAILTFQCADGIPHFIPEHIADKLLPLWAQGGSGNFAWEKTWPNLSTLLHAFQILFIRNSLPSEFPFVLLRNILENPSLKQELESSGALIYWNHQDLHFNEPWDLSTLETAIQAILTQVNDQSRKTEEKKNKRGRISPLEPQEEQIGRLTAAEYLKIIHLKGDSNVDKSILRAAAILKRYGSPLLALQEKSPNSKNLPVINTRVDLMTSLVDKAEPIVMRELVHLWSKFPIAIPLLVQNIERVDPTAITYLCIIPSIHRLSIPPMILFDEPYRLLVFIRMGEAVKIPGKSTLLNKLCMKNERCFSSRLDNAEVKPSFLNGLVEFIPCSALSLNSQLYQQITKESIFIGNLHGDALKLPTPEILKLLAKIATAFVCIWMPQSWKSLQESKKKLKMELGSLSNVFDLCIDPYPEVVEKIDPDLCLISGDIGEDNAHKMSGIITKAIKIPPMTINVQELERQDFDKISFTLPTRPSEVEQILGAIKKTNDVRVLLSLQMSDFNTKEQIEELFTKNLDYVYLIGEFSKILLLPDNTRELALGCLSEELARGSFFATKGNRNLLKKLLNDLKISKDENQKIQLQNHIKQARNKISNRTLSIQHLIAEIGRIYNICPDKLYHFAQIPGGFPEVVANLMLKSYCIQIPSSSTTFCSESWFSDTITAIKDKWSDLNIFVVSIFGEKSTEKTNLLKSMFGSCFGNGDREIIFESQGLEMRLIFLDTNLRESLSIDAILVLDSEGISDPTHQTEKALASLILSVSNLTLVTATKKNIEMIGFITELALLSNIRLAASQTHFPNIVFTYISDKDKLADYSDSELTDQIKQHIKKAEKIAHEYSLEAGVMAEFGHKMWKINLAVELEEIVQRIQPLHTAEPSGEHHAQIVTLYRKILNRVFGTKTMLPTFFENLKRNWDEINKFEFPTNANGADEIMDSLKLKIRLDKLKDLMEKSFSHHCADNEYYIYTEMGKILRDENDDSELSGDTVKRNIANEIQGRIADIYRTCNFEGKGICPNCQNAMTEEDDILAEFSSSLFKTVITNSITEHLLMSRDAIIKLTQQMMTSLEVKQLKGELSLNMKEIIREKCAQAKKSSPLPIWLTIKQDVSTKLTVIPSKRRFKAELKQVYANLDMDIGENLYEDFIQFEPAYSFGHLLGSSLDDNYLNWIEGNWLLNKLLEIPPNILIRRNARIFENGMIRELKTETNKVLAELETKNGKKLLPGFVLKVHGFVIHRLVDAINVTEKSWNADYNPISILNQNPDPYIKELHRMIAV